MKASTIRVAMIAAITSALSQSCSEPPAPPSPPAASSSNEWSPLAAPCSSAALSLGEAELAKLQEANPRETVITSPLSIAAALTMLGQGARADTSVNMASGLRLKDQGLTLTDAASGYQAVHRDLTSSTGVTLSLANGIWVDQRLKLNSAFAQTQQDRFSARIVSADFQDRATVGEINRFVSGATKGQIPGILDDLSGPGVVLVNALYFNGAWLNPFEESETRSETFTTAHGRKIQTPTMHITGWFGYRETSEFQSVELPYLDPRFQLVLVLLKNKDASPAVGWTTSMIPNEDARKGSIALPKLDLTWGSDLTSWPAPER